MLNNLTRSILSICEKTDVEATKHVEDGNPTDPRYTAPVCDHFSMQLQGEDKWCSDHFGIDFAKSFLNHFDYHFNQLSIFKTVNYKPLQQGSLWLHDK